MNARIQEKRWITPKLCLLVLEAEDAAAAARPGQFVMVKVSSGLDPFLRRPLGIMEAGEGTLTLLFEVVGRGTAMLAAKAVGEELELLGPLGKGFSLEASLGILVAGGRGLVPLRFLASVLTERGIPVRFFLGVRKQEELPLFELLQGLPAVFGSCEEESERFCGDVVALLRRHLAETPLPPGTRVYACGPEGMLRTLQTVPELEGVPVEVSLESLMGCGFGVCLSCAVEQKDRTGYHYVCKDGPVFPLSEVRL